MRKILYVFSLHFITICFPCLGNNFSILSPKQMEEDVDYFFDVMKHNHVNLYEKYSEQVFDSLHIALKESINDSLSVNHFAVKMASINRYFDEHACIYPFYNSSSYGFFPWIRIKENNIYMDSNIVKSINNIQGAEIANLLDGLFSWTINSKRKGNNQQFYLACLFRQYYEIPPPYTLTLYNPVNKKSRDIVLQSADLATRITDRSSSDEEYYTPPLSERYFIDNDIAVLYYNTSDFENRREYNKEQMDSIFEHITTNFFKKLKIYNINNLFIDISQNGGGSDLVHKYIARFLKSESFKINYKIYINASGLLINSKYGDFLELTNDEKDRIDKQGYFYRSEINKGNLNGYQGNIYIIMGLNTFSAAFDFCSFVKRGKIGLLIGEASGQRSPYGGNVDTSYMPNSKIEIWSPTTFDIQTPIIVDENGFLQPDIPYPLDHPLELEDFKKIIELSKKQ